MSYLLVEKTNHNAVHGLFDDADRAKKHLKEVIPTYVERGYFSDKTLTSDSFEIIERLVRKPKERHHGS